MTDQSHRVVYLDEVFSYHDRQLDELGPHNNAGYAPYTFGGMKQKWAQGWEDRHHQDYAPIRVETGPNWGFLNG